MTVRDTGASRLLFVDDEAGIRKTVSYLLKKEGYRFDLAASGLEAKKQLEGEPYDLVITDIKMPDCSGMELLQHVREVSPETSVMLITAYPSEDTVREALRLGGCRDYVTKPFDMDELRVRIENLLERRRLEAENASLRRALDRRYRVEGMVGRSEAIREVHSLVERIAATSSTVLVQGESGTGKELIARAIHAQSARRDGPFVSINCGALPDELLESELFGHVKGSFTGAVASKRGLFEVAHGGSILLDEIGETSTAMQVKLLRVLQERRFRRVGGTDEIAVDVRVIAATNQDLGALVQAKTFREDLFYRINVIPVQVPPLRQRPGDIPLLAEHFLTSLRESMGKSIARISDEAMALLERYSWPGNVRELENVIERAVALETSPAIEPESLPKEVRAYSPAPLPDRSAEIPAEGFDLDAYLEGCREGFMRAALEQTGKVQSKAARQLGMTFRSFRYFARKYGLTGGGASPGDSSEE